jgi:hypothetical protein
MDRYRRRPNIVKAVQIVPENLAELERIGQDVAEIEVWQALDDDGPRLDCVLVYTREGRMRGPVGHWLVRGTAGEWYICDPDIFAASFDIVTD